MSETVPESEFNIEWWETEDGEYNWHAKSLGNHEVLFGSVQGYVDKSTMLQYVMTWFPHVEVVPRDGEPQSSSDAAAEQLKSEGQAE